MGGVVRRAVRVAQLSCILGTHHACPQKVVLFIQLVVTYLLQRDPIVLASWVV